MDFIKPDVCKPSGTLELPMLDVYMPMMKSAAIISAGKMGVFEALANEPMSTADLAEKVEVSPEGLATLIDFLTVLGYLEKKNNLVSNTEYARRWFTSHGDVDYTPGLLWTLEAWPMMQNLALAVKTGVPDKSLWDSMSENSALGPLFSSYMAAFARDLGPDLIREVPVHKEFRKLLDLGGSHGLHSIRFCQHYSNLNATILDLPSALVETPNAISKAALSERISLRPGSILESDFGHEYDVALYLCVAHNMSSADNRKIFKRIFEALNFGGILVVHDYIEQASISAFHAAFNLTLMYETGTRIHRMDSYSDWLINAGFSDVSVINLNPLEKGSLIIARKQ